jgi:prepilin-type N-terminal cleavage/methylation domain-containing protein
MSLRHDRRLEAGFGLAELMVAMAVLGIVLIAIFMAFFRTNTESARINRLVEFRQSARAAVQLIERDLRMAGSGWGRSPVSYSDVGGNPAEMFGLTPSPGSGHSDSLRLFGGWTVQTTLTQPMLTSAADCRVASVAGFNDSDLIVVTNGTSSHLLQVTDVDVGNSILTHDAGSPFNQSSGLVGWPASGYTAGSKVYRASIVTYRVDSTSFGRPCLVRQEFGGEPQIVAYDLNKFQMWYRMQSDTVVRDADSLGGIAFVDKIIPRVYVRVTDPHKPTIIDSVWAEVRPRTF